jgi:hypothetical protein
MKNFIILLLTVFILSCATTAPQISDDGFISSQPNFQVQFNKPIVEKSVKSRRIRDGEIKTYHFSVNNTEGILIRILTVFQSTRFDYIYGPEKILKNWGRMVLDPVVIDGRQWIKFVDVFNNKHLFTGYFRIMDQAFISVGRICSADAYTEEIGSFRKGASLQYGQVKLWDEAFAHTNQLFSIGMVAPAESQSEKPLSAKEIKATPKKTKTEAERQALEKETPKVASIPKDVSVDRVSLRKKPMKMIEFTITEMLLEYDFFEISKNTRGSFVNDFVDNNDGTVTDKATGLMWQKSGSSSSLENRSAKKYIKQLNKGIPTVEELASLLAKSSKSGVHIDPVFDHTRSICWTVDKCDSTYSRHSGAWIVDFKQGQILQAWYGAPIGIGYSSSYAKNYINYAKAVRSIESQSERPLSAKETKTEAERAPLEKETPKVASIPKDVSVDRVSLRKKPLKETDIKITDMLLEYDFFDRTRNIRGSFVNDFVDNNDGTVTDKATGLMWQKSGSSIGLNNQRANIYIERLNQERFAGHSDWRIPTVEELASLLARRRKNGVHIAPVFDYKQTRCWTIDNTNYSTSRRRLGAWLIDFQNGAVGQASWLRGKPDSMSSNKNPVNYVKAVRSVK